MQDGITRILIVDDDAAARAMLAGWLGAAGYDCEALAEPEAALATCEHDPPDAAIIGIGGAGDDGMKLARTLCEQRSDLGVIVMSAARSFEHGVAAMRMGAFDYLLTPCTRGELLESVDRAVTWRTAVTQWNARRPRGLDEIFARQAALMQALTEAAPGSIAALDVVMETLCRSHADLYAHSRRVARWSVAVGCTLGLTDAVLDDIERAALLHDIGKLAMPRALLMKAAPLTPQERELLQTHAPIGAEVVAVLPHLEPASRLVAAVHERWDGSGYPLGIPGAAIPLGARIIAVADAFDALTSRRPYREPMDVDLAHVELVRQAGSAFDPDVVRAWLRAVDDSECS
jgi:response regulator RpfG family c-di-GMP phosphodiesterase